MTSVSEEIAARKEKYDRVEYETDVTGRVIGVKRLKPSQQLAIQEMAPGLEGTTSVVDDKTGAVFEVPKSSPLIMAASVCEIDGNPVMFAQNRAQLNAVLDRLDEEGLQAVAAALAKFSPPKPESEKTDPEAAADAETAAIKN